MEEFVVKTSQRNELVEITQQVQDIVSKSKVKNGICLLYAPHATAGITINENYDDSVPLDLLDVLTKIAPQDAGYRHNDGNADAHMKSSIVGVSLHVFVESGKIVLGTYQGIFLCEFDGPRSRKVLVQISEK